MERHYPLTSIKCVQTQRCRSQGTISEQTRQIFSDNKRPIKNRFLLNRGKREAGRKRERESDRQTDRQTDDGQTDGRTNGQTDRPGMRHRERDRERMLVFPLLTKSPWID